MFFVRLILGLITFLFVAVIMVGMREGVINPAPIFAMLVIFFITQMETCLQASTYDIMFQIYSYPISSQIF